MPLRCQVWRRPTAGGLAEGFRQAGFGVAAGTDVDPDAFTLVYEVAVLTSVPASVTRAIDTITSFP